MSIFFDLFKKAKGDSSEKVDLQLKIQRFNICDSCEEVRELFHGVKNCNLCGCIIIHKIKYKDEKCPKNKW
jgi:hypothetical protein